MELLVSQAAGTVSLYCATGQCIIWLILLMIINDLSETLFLFKMENLFLEKI